MLFVPLLVTSATWPPEERPASAVALLVVTRNSCSESSVARNAPVKASPCVWSLLSTPSSVTLVWSLRAPLTEPLRLSDAWLMWLPLPVKATPGCKLKMLAASRPSNGRYAICSLLKACPKLASCMLTSGAAVPTTSTTVVVPATFIATLSEAGVFTVRITFFCVGLVVPLFVLGKASARVLALSRIYEQLYLSGQILEVDLATYLERLIGPLLETYSAESSRFTLVARFERASLDAQRAALAGLILSELVSNATKYAYPNGESGELRVSLLDKAGMIELRVSDDGPGLPSGLDPATTESMGFHLLRMLADQMDAELSVASPEGRGVDVTIRFKP